MSRRHLITLIVLVAGTAALAVADAPVRGVWPPVVALAVILVTRRALIGLLAGGYAGAILLSGGNPWDAYLAVGRDHLAPSLTSPWKLGAVAFTLVLGGFAAVLEAGGGFAALLHRLTGPGRDSARRFQAGALGLGLLCFFDGLANSMMVGRVGRSAAERCGVSRVKLAYLVDSTSSAVACVAVVSTWIAFQLSMIESAFATAGQTVNPYAVFLHSLPYNFHCWFTLVLLPLAILWRFEPGPMRRYEDAARAAASAATGEHEPSRGSAGAASALVPVGVLLLSFLGGFVMLGSPRPIWPLTRDKLVAAFGSDAGPLVLVLAGLIATLSATLLLPRTIAAGRWTSAARAFGSGVRTMTAPVLILVAAWILGSVVQSLGTAEILAGLATRSGALWLLPAAVFVSAALVSFATGTSWGTMGLLFPLTVPAAAVAGAQLDPVALTTLLEVVVAAVFSGAVFGDHCSPFSDTTIVTSIACEVEPHDHVRTQLPYALITAAAATLLGFVPAGLGVSPWLSLLAGVAALAAVAYRFGVRVPASGAQHG
jgi:Na+/H+ antiporter NhaC